MMEVQTLERVRTAPEDVDTSYHEKNGTNFSQVEIGAEPHQQVHSDVEDSETDDNSDDSEDTEDNFPEGGLEAWLVVASAFLTMFPGLGFMVSIGTLQDYWKQHQLSHYTSRDIGWIPSVFVYLAAALGIWIGPLFDRYGPRWIELLGSIGFLVMVFCLAECTEYWQMMLCCGIVGGVSGAVLLNIPLAVVAQWFKEKRALTQGIAMVGSSFGGLTIPLILRATFPKYGYRWSLRILGFLFFGCLVLANILMKGRIKPSIASKKKPMIDFAVFGDLRFSLLTISVFGFELVVFGSLGILPTYATLSKDYPPDAGFYVISILSGASCVGRIMSGYAADKLGRFNIVLVMTVFTLAWMLVLWLPFGARSLPVLYCFSAFFGFGSGSWMALAPACIGQLCRAEEFGRYYGTVYFIASLATLICIPISGELVEVVGPQAMVGFFCAATGLSLVTFAFSRWACLGRRWTVMAKV
jgi:MFS family permease